MITNSCEGPNVMISARAKVRHAQVGRETNHAGTCVDHTLHLTVDESLEKQSSLARQKFHLIQKEAGLNPLSVHCYDW